MARIRNRDSHGTCGKLAALLVGIGILAPAETVFAQDATVITIESWRNDDLPIWQDEIIPAFEAQNPGIKVVFAPSTQTGYDAALDARLEAGSAGDLITCRPFDPSLAIYEKGRLAPLNDLPGMENFSDVAKLAWSTDDGSVTFCVPMASVIHGFLYNKNVFEELGIEVPTTEEELFAMLETIEQDGDYIPMALGTGDQWEAAVLGYYNIGPNYWKGEEGRRALVAGAQKLTDPQWVEPYAALSRWKDYLGEGFETRSYADSQQLFAGGRAAIYPAGSWEIPLFRAQAGFEMGAFPPPPRRAGDTCYISDHNDIGIGLNTKSENAEAARTFLTWVASPEFGTIYANALAGFFSLSSTPVRIEEPLAREFVSWRERCQSTIRPSAAIVGRGGPNLDLEMWRASANVINGTSTPQQAGEQTQKGLDGWYKPAQ